ncbi:MAG TPA: hypothetical protein VMJ13_01110 [Candidatus Acidoferrum sp.]|nr:hypothetical protein [Candidatus Acidoferrum sp.]
MPAALAAAVVEVLVSVFSFADVSRIHQTAITQTAAMLDAVRSTHLGGICENENRSGAGFPSSLGESKESSGESCRTTPGIFGSSGLKGLLFIPCSGCWASGREYQG